MTGSKFDVGEVLFDSLNLILKRPVITLPIAVLILITSISVLLLVMSLSESLNLQVETTGDWMEWVIIILFLLFVVILLIAYVLVIGAYPLIVKETIHQILSTITCSSLSTHLNKPSLASFHPIR